ncbi:MAG: response regulator [Candidatus Eisenbacteria bacterium]|nr:response regulator [Candidatus Eisenbacteria bacterium]
MGKNVLIVDDERLLTRTLANALREAGYETVTATSAEQAEKHIFSEERFDIVLLDNRLPRTSGLSILKRMRDENVCSKIILMTAYDSPEVKAEAKRLKVDKYVKKPFDLTRMLSEIEQLLGKNEVGGT